MKFSQIYSQLNPAQKQAVDTVEGPVMVVAGPGTGKTQVLAARIANIIKKTDTDPKNILALTFTESAAKNMRERVVGMIGLDGYKVRIETFHGFCRSVVSEYPEYFPLSSTSIDPDEASDFSNQVISELEQFKLIQLILESGQFEALKPLKKKDLYVKSILSAISDLKREGVTPDEFGVAIEKEWQDLDLVKSKTKRNKLERKKLKNLELKQIYELYENHLRRLGKYDFNDMIMMVLLAFKKHKDLLLNYQEELHYFLVDEYQDTNTAQNEVVSMLASYWQEKANIFVVGDPHQSIFRFQGASLSNMSQFLKKYPQAKIINLNLGYRCPPDVYQAAFELINSSNSPEKLTSKSQSKLIELLNFDKPLKSVKPKVSAGSIYLYEAPTQLAEYIFIAKKVRQLIKDGVKPESIAVLYRRNDESINLMQVFDKWALEYDVAGGGNALEVEEIRQLIEFLRAVYLLREGAEEINLFEVLSYDWIWVDNLLAMKLARLANRQGLSLVDLVEKDKLTENNGQGVLEITPAEKALVQKFLDELRELGSFDAKHPFVHFFEKAIEATGYLKWIQQRPNSHELILALNSLFDEIKALNYENHNFRLKDFLQSVELMDQYRLIVKIDDLNIKEGRVTLSTVHKAKGLEWDHVFVVGLVDGKWGNRRKNGSKIPLPSNLVDTTLEEEDQEAEEGRLFYVALTRAAEAVYLSYAQTETIQGRVKEHVASQYVSLLKELNLVQLIDHQVDKEIEADLIKILRPAPEKLTTTSGQRAFFQYLVDKFSLSPSSLNKYLKDPKEFALESLIRVPRAKPANMAYGTAVHKALEKVNRTLINEGRLLSLTEVLDEFRLALEVELISDEDFKRWLLKGKESLTTYYEQRLATGLPLPLQAERSFRQVYLDDIHLTGKVDRVEWLDQKQKWVRVVDYKTGKARSLNEIEAKTETAKEYLSDRELTLPEFLRGSYKRQLLFYKILTDLDPSFPYEVKQASLDFVEPNKSGKIAPQRVFEFKAEEIKAMKALIKEVMQEIRELKFLEFLK